MDTVVAWLIIGSASLITGILLENRVPDAREELLCWRRHSERKQEMIATISLLYTVAAYGFLYFLVSAIVPWPPLGYSPGP